jgi:restriction system protein
MYGPLLRAVRDLGGSARPQEVYERVAAIVGLSPEKRAEQTPSGVPRFENQIAWARFYLARDGLLDSSRRGVWSLTEKGRAQPDISASEAMNIFRRVRSAMEKNEGSRGSSVPARQVEEVAAPDEAVVLASTNYRDRVLDILQSIPAGGFERFCQRLLREAGFQEVNVIGRSGDGGIDGTGILQVNALVSFKVLFQCKRYKGSVVPAQVRDFRGAMMGRADKGIILTTGSFTSEARKEAVRDGVPPIELVDGEKLVDMLEELEVGLLPVKAFRIDESFFGSFGSPDAQADVTGRGER